MRGSLPLDWEARFASLRPVEPRSKRPGPARSGETFVALKTMMLLAVITAAPATCTLPGETETGALRDASPAALAALPEGIDPAFLIRDENGCYGVAIEAAEVPTGPPLLDAAGNIVCDA